MKGDKAMKNLTPELIAKAKAAESAEELLEIAKANGVELTAEEVKTYFEQLNATGAVSDDELDTVAGGACGYADDGRKIVDPSCHCSTNFECKNGCGNNADMGTEKCRISGEEWRCYNCVSVSFEGGKMYCNNPAMGK